FVASGGVTTVADVTAMRALGMSGAIIGKAIYEGTISEAQLRIALAA
ncbi:MAG: bifunctional 1-(5-phosphoribosyl)-5-((5-phosphoribosylamino)methylideneamino)imidazole-4-carboxamide isomerase/phosphoribosylanthranilate isomerase PriA, partial [Hymenobacter sp.]